MAKGRGRGRHYSKAVRGAGAGVKAPGNLALAARSGGAEVQPWGLADAVNAIAARAGLSNPMPRSALDQVPFGPNWALPPQPLDPARPDSGRPEPRVFEYPVAFNIPGNGNRPVPWATLYAASTNIDIVRRCIEIRKRHLRGMEWGWSVTEEAIAEALLSDPGAGREDVETKLREQYLPEIRRATEFWRKPWRANGLSFGQWLNGWMDQHLVLDGVAIYPRTTYGGDVTDLEIIDASTIKLLLDNRGARPEHPFPAFQQELYGFPRGEFTVSVDPETGMMHGGYQSDQLYYHREGFRPQTPYGFSAVEQSLISAKLYLKRQGWMLAEYDDGSTPLMWLVPSPTAEMWSQMTADQRRRWEQSLNDEMTGNTAGRHRVKVTPPGFQPIAMPSVEERYKPEYDLHLIKMLAGFFNVTVAELGLTEPKGLGSSGYHEGQEAVEGRVGQRPDTVMVAESINDLSHDFLRVPRAIEFKFIDPQADDQKVEDEIWAARRARGTVTLNDDRRRIGMAPYTFAEADEPMLLAGDKATPLDGIKAVLQMAQQAQQASLEASNAMLDADGEKADLEAEELEGASAEKALEMASYRRWARKRGGRAGRMFICKSLDPADWPGSAVPADVDFEHWEWVPDGIDIDKAANDNWRTLARDGRGRWLPRGRMRADALGPAAPGKEVLAGLQRQARAGRAGVTAAELAEAQASFDQQAGPGPRGEARRRLMESAGITPESIARERRAQREQVERAKAEREQAERDMLRAHAARLDPADIEAGRAAHQRRAEELSGKLGGELTDAERARIDAKWADPEQQAVLVANDRADRAALRAKIANAEERLGADRSRWTEAQRAQVEKWERQQNTVGVSTASATIDPMTTTKQQPERARKPKTSKLTAEQKRLEALTDKREQAQARFEGAQRESARLDRAARDAGGADLAANARRDAALAEERRLKEVFYAAQDAERAAAPSPSAPSADSARAAYAELTAANGGNPVPLVELRAKLGGTREQQDAVLRGLAGSPDVMFWPEENQKVRTAADEAAALHIGGEDKNFLHIDAPQRSVLDTVRESSEAAARASAVIDSVPGLREGVARQQGGLTPALRAKLDAKREASAAAKREARTPKRGTAPEFAGMAFEHKNPGTGYGAPDERMETVLPDGREAGLSRTGESWGWFIRGAGALDDDGRGFSSPEAAAADMRAKAPRTAPDGPVTVREEGRQNNPGFALPTTPPAAEASKTQRAVAESFDRVAGEFGADPEVAQWRARALDVAGDMDTARGDARATAQLKAGEIQREFSYAMAGARAAKEARETGGDENAARVEAAESARIAYLDREITRRERQIRDYSGETRKMLRGQLNEVKAQRKAAADRIEAAKPTPAARKAEAVAAATPDAPSAPVAEQPAAPRPIPRREPGQVKRGDLIVVERTDSPTESMRREGHTERKTYEIFRVTSATRDGQAAKVSRLDWHGLDDAGQPVRNVFLRSHGKRTVIPGDQIDVAALRESLLARHYDGHPGQAKPHDDLRELSGVLRSHLREAPAAKAPARAKPARKAEAVAAATPDAPSAPAGTHEDRIARLAPMTESGPQYNRGVRDALDSYREIRRQGYDGEIKLMEAEAAAGLRTQAEVAAARNAEIMGVKTPPAFVAPKLSSAPSAQSVNDAMAAQMANALANPTAFGPHGTKRGADVKRGDRLMLRNQHAVEVLEDARRAAPDSQGRDGYVFRVRREDQGVEGVMRVNDGDLAALAAPKPDRASKPKREIERPADRGAPLTPAEQTVSRHREVFQAWRKGRATAADVEAARVAMEAAKTPVAPSAVTRTGDAALAAAPRSVEATGARKVDRAGTAALERYRGKAFTEINRELRAGDVSAANRKTVEQIDRVMDESRLTDQVEVYRGIGNVEAVFGDAARRKLVGHEWSDAAPQSTTTDADIADRFLASGGNRRAAAVIKMRVPAGVGAIEMSDARYEAELLLQRGLRMRVISDTGPWRRGQKKPRMIDVEVIPA